ncbi:Transcriptional activator protein CopR [compost metagenome]
MVKPFAFSELLSRVRALLRRAHPAALKKHIKIADLEIDLIKHKVTRGSKQIDLTAKELSLLEFMLKHRGEILPKSLISSQVWGMSFESGTNVIEVAVSRLRAKIDDGFEIKLIHTSRGMGYVIDVL